MFRRFLQPLLVRAFRAGVVVALAWLIHQQYAFFAAQRDAMLTADRVRDFFPLAATLGPRDPDTAVQRVLDENGLTLGLVTQTAPLSDHIIGYSGPTNTLVAMDAQGKVVGLRVLHSGDTPEHLGKVLRSRKFFDTFKGIKLGDPVAHPQVDAVSGATLTSTAIAQGVLNRLGKPGPSLRFPAEITLAEVQSLKPTAASLQPVPGSPGLFHVQDAQGQIIAQVTRTAPAGDGVIGYKGPSDSLMLLSADGRKLEAFRLRKSYDTRDYVGYVTGDNYFTHLFDGMPLAKLAGLDFNQAKVEGVSGATETSWAVAEGLKRRSQSLAPPPAKDRWAMIRELKPVDLGLAVVIIFSLIMTFTHWRGRRWLRWIHQAALIGYAGFFSGSMLSQGLLLGWAQHSVPWQSAPVLVALAALSLTLPLFTRRQFYCHHYCPHGTLQQWLAHRSKWASRFHLPPAWGRWLERIPLLLIVVILALVLCGRNPNLNALEPFDAWLIRVAGWSTLTIAVLGLVASLFVPMAYCRYGCPTGAVLKYLRYAGAGDRLGRRDAVAGLLVVLAFAAHAYYRGQ